MIPNDPVSSPASDVLFPSRLDWLCQPEQIEGTLARLVALQHWQKASRQLLYADRQGLQEVLALILAHACTLERVRAVAYRDGSARFPHELLLESVAEQAARRVLTHLHSLSEPALWPSFWPEGDDVYHRAIRPLYQRITGTDFPRAADAINALEVTQIQAFLQPRVQTLVEHAQQTRRPIPSRSLARLCLAPVDLLPMRANRWPFFESYDSWRHLDSSDQRKLDPEGESSILFQAVGQTVTDVFPLPLRRAALFLPSEELRALPRTNQEHEPSGDGPGDAAMFLAQPVKEILHDLGVTIERVCPYGLQEKQSYLAHPAIRRLRWPTMGHDHLEWADDPWEGLIIAPPTCV